MGRPINKKYFGGRDAGVTGGYNRTIDGTAKMAGTSVSPSGIIITTPGSYTAGLPSVTFPVPLGGEGLTAARATGTTLAGVLSATLSGGSGGSGYAVSSTFNVTIAGTGNVTPATISVTTNSSGVITTVNSVVSAGTYSGTSPGTTPVAVVGGTGTSATLVLTMKVTGVTVTNAGDGYGPSQSPLTLTFSSGSAAGTAALAAEVTSGYSGADYPSIVCYAITAGSTSRQYSDIIKQENGHSYRVINQDNTTFPGTLCHLVATTPTVLGQMAINLTDSAGGTYWVYKITNRMATVIRNTGTQFSNYQKVPWTFGSAVANVSVKIDSL